MLKRLLQLIEAAEGPVHTQELSTQLGVAPSAVAGMLQTLVQTGRLQMAGEGNGAEDACHTAVCRGCHGTTAVCRSDLRPPTYLAKHPIP